MMKLSRFNNQIAYGDKTLLYNSYADRFILVEPLLNDLFTSIKLKGPDWVEKIHPTFYSLLKDRGFLVSEETDELKLVQLRREYVDLEDDTQYKLIVNPTMNCNFKCWYCYESHIKGSKMTPQIIESVKRHISYVVENMKNLKTFHISWFGGEPLLFYEKVIKPISYYAAELLDKHCIDLSTTYTTNGYLINQSMILDFYKSYVRNFQITIDGNREIHNAVRFVNENKGSYNDIINNILLLCRNKLTVTLRLNYTKSNLSEFKEIISDLGVLEPEYRKYITITFHKVWQETSDYLGPKVSDLSLEFRAAGFKAVYGGLPDNTKNSCYADRKYQATINYNGDVFKCTARNFSSETKEGSLNENGQIEWNQTREKRLDIKFKNKPCLECPILPICNGGCSQKALENEDRDYCIYNFDYRKKEEIILNKYITLNDQFKAYND